MNELITATTGLPSPEETTVPDMQLAKALGYDQPRYFRKLIKRHAASLEAMGSLGHRVTMIEVGKGARREVTEYHLNRAQAAFLVAKAGTVLADSLAVKMAEVFALYSAGGLVAVDAKAQAELDAIAARETERRRIHTEEKEARSGALRIMGHTRGLSLEELRPKARERALALRNGSPSPTYRHS